MSAPQEHSSESLSFPVGEGNPGTGPVTSFNAPNIIGGGGGGMQDHVQESGMTFPVGETPRV